MELVVSNKNNTAVNEAKRNNPTGSRVGTYFADIFLHFRTHTENKHVQKTKIPLFLFLAVVMMAFSFARQSCCCCSTVCSFHTAAHIIFYFFHFSSPLIFDSCTHKHAQTSILTSPTYTLTTHNGRSKRTLLPLLYTFYTMTDPKFQQTRKMLPTIVLLRGVT